MKILCVDVGGTSIKHGIIDEELNFTDKGNFIPDGSTLETYVESLGSLYDRYKDKVEGIAFSMPGIIHPENGYFYTGGAYDNIVHEVNLKELLEKRIPVPMSLENDAKAAGYAELGYGALKDHNDAILMTLGYGIGGCLIYDHKVVYGKHYSAGELSYVIADYHHPDSAYTFGALNGSRGLLKIVQEKLETEETYTGREIFEIINNGNEKAREALHEFCKELSIQIYNLNVAFDPEVFAIGGGISSQKLLYEELNMCFEELEREMNPFARKPVIVPCVFGNDANMIGAYHKFMLQHGKNQ